MQISFVLLSLFQKINNHFDHALCVQKTYKETDWKCRKVCIYLGKFKKAQIQTVKGLQRCLSNEYLDHKENDLPTSSSEDQSLSMTQASWRYFRFIWPLLNVAIFFTQTTFCRFSIQVISLYLSYLFRIFNLDSSFYSLSSLSFFFKRNTSLLYQSLSD